MSNLLLSVIMPFHNEEATVAQIVSQVLGTELPIPMELVLVDDGSTDSSPAMVAPFIGDPRVKYVRSPRKSGKGAAVNLGIGASKGSIILIQDADLEYSPEEYGRVLALLLGRRCDFALGSRVLGAGGWKIHSVTGRPFYSWALNVGSRFLTLAFRGLFGIPVSDPLTMMKVFRRECLHGIEFESRGFDWDWEILCKLVHRGLVPLEVPISYNARGPGEGKKLRMWEDGWAALAAIFRFRFGKY
jgi:glycosyltransferase involved in cell wall biosynthesis